MVPFFAHLEDKVSLLCGLEEEASFYDRIFRFVNFLWNTYVGLMAGVQAPGGLVMLTYLHQIILLVCPT